MPRLNFAFRFGLGTPCSDLRFAWARMVRSTLRTNFPENSGIREFRMFRDIWFRNLPKFRNLAAKPKFQECYGFEIWILQSEAFRGEESVSELRISMRNDFCMEILISRISGSMAMQLPTLALRLGTPCSDLPFASARMGAKHSPQIFSREVRISWIFIVFGRFGFWEILPTL